MESDPAPDFPAAHLTISYECHVEEDDQLVPEARAVASNLSALGGRGGGACKHAAKNQEITVA